jgi:phosphatidate cytidylyltransferase
LIRTRIITGALLGCALAATVLFLPTFAMAALFGALWVVGAWEWAGLARLQDGPRIAYTAVCALCMFGALLLLDAQRASWILALALVWWALAFVMVLSYPRKFPMGGVALAGFVVLVPSWLLLALLHRSEPLGRELVMTLLAIVWAADVGAYTFGRWLGRVKLAPTVSPGKTWEGVTGGVLAAAAAAWVAALWLRLPVGGLVAVGIATALVSVVGDLAVSVFKRNAGLKDSGSLLPGHGGVMDRIDSLTAAVPIFVLGIHAAGIGS